MHSHPLVEIHFVRFVGEGQGTEEETIVRHWYHVPQDGDAVALDHHGERIEARIHGVFWNDPEGIVEIRLG